MITVNSQQLSVKIKEIKMRRTIYFLVAVLLCFISMPNVQAQVVGSIPGQFNVGSSGAASYTIPIDCPAGINGMQPNISLVYNSQAGDGPLGIGWGIGGLSSVSRTTSNLFSDGAVSGLDLSSELFSLDGNRLFVDQHVDLPGYSGAYTYKEGWKPGGKPKPTPSPTDPTPTTPDFWGDLPTTCGSTCQSIVGSTYYSENKTYQKIESFGVLHMYAESIEFAGYFDSSVADQKFYTKSWSKIPAGPGLFRITSKNGTVIEYGAISAAADANNEISSPPLTWYVSKITDANGNCQTYSYQLQGKQMVIKKIDYSSNGNTASFASMEFNYVVKSQKNTTYILWSTIDDLLLLKNIQLKVNGTLIKQYVLSYDTQNNKYFLNNIALVGVNNEQLNSTVIAWGNNNNVISTLTAGIPLAGKTDRSLFATDVDGDGFSDLIDLYNGAGSVSSVDIYKGGLSINGQTPLSAKLSYPYTLASRYDFKQFNDRGADGGFLFCDFKGNGKKTILVPDYNEAGNVGNVTFRDIQSGQQINQVLSSKSGLTAFAKGDINNDGIDEIVSIEKTASTTGIFKGKVYYVTKAVNADNQLGAADQIAGYDFGPGGGMAGGAAATPKDLFIADFNGDGLNDLLVTTNAGCFLYMNNGGSKSGGLTRVSFTRVATVTGFNSSCSTIKPGDFNGDGLTDFIINEHNTGIWKLAINNGTWGFDYQTLSGFTAVEEANTTRNDDKEDCIVTDFNHDGKSDVVLVDAVYNSSGAFVQTNINWYASTGVNFTVAKTVTTTDENYSFSKYNCTGDFDGDGREEVLSYGSDIYNGGNKSDQVFIQRAFNANSEAYQIKSITDGLGKKTEISYQPLTYTTADNRAFYTKGTGAVYPMADVQMPLYCVSKVSEPDGLGGLNTTEFAYSGAQAQLTGRGFLGFKSRTISNATTNRKIVSTTDMNLSYYLPDKTTTEVSAVIGGAVSKTETNYSNTASGKTLLSLPAKTVEYDYLNDLSKTTDYVSFDAYGNATSVKTTQGDLVSTQTSTYVQKGGWCPNKPETVTVTRQQGGNSYTRSKSYTYDDKGNLTKETTDPGDANQLSVEYKDRNAFGQPTKTQTTANGLMRTASIAFTPSGRFVQSKTDVLGQTTTYSWDETRGLLNSETSRLGTTTYTYNGLGQLTNTAYPDGTQKSQTAQWASTGNTFGAKFYITQQASGMAASYTWFDALQREVVREGYGLNGKVSRIFTQYRADGKTYRVSQPTFDTQATAWDAVYDYYPEGRLKTVTTPVGTTTSTYNGKTTTVASPEGTQATTLNAAGQTATSTVNGKTVTYAYYASGKAQTATPDGGAAVAMEYDLQGNRTKLTDPDAGVSSAGYNGYGELKWEKQTNNAAQGEISTTYNYNATTGLIENRVRNGETTAYGYDTQKRLATIEIAGQHKQSYSYGDYDRITGLTELINGTKTLVKGMEYDAYGRIYKETFPSGYYIVNNYDSYGKLNEVTDKYSRSIWKATEANARGQITKLNKGIKETVYGYDEAKGQLTSMAAAGVVNYSYGYDAKNNPEYRGDNLLGHKEHFSYDSHNRLTNWDIMNSANTVLKPNSLTYDAATGNIATKSDLNNLAMNYGEGNGKPHALTTVMGKPDVISASDLNVTYSDFRKIKTLTEGSKQYTITYGVDDQRRISVQTQGAASVTKYYLGNYEEETDNLGNVKKIHYLSGGAMLINLNGVETLYYGYADNQGSLVALTDASGNVVEKYAYDPWGARRNPNDLTQKDTRSSFITNRGYTGHEHLDAFGIINMNGRVYDPLTAQFYSPDPFIQSGSDWKNYNRYSYCMNNPTRYTDPSGYKFTGERTSNDSQRELWSNYAGSYGGGGSSSFRAWAASHRGSVSYNWENYRYEYANGDDASSNSALDQLYSRTSPQDIQNYSGSSLGYDHLYTLNIGGQLRLAGSLNGEITGIKSGNFVTTNNGFAAVLAANSEAVAWDQGIGRGNNSPDADGRLTFNEARNWWRNGEGESLMVSIKSIDLGKIHVSDFGSKKIKSFNLAGSYKSSLNDALVYGSITLEYLGKNQVMVRNLHDIYDFDIKPWTSETALRNLLTIGGNIVNGSGNPYIIWIYGKTTIEP
jgi:RHS repeat-associated protein